MPIHKNQIRLFELDAVRALAVTIVVLFHLKVAGFGFGYLGVDIFFVLSGYLMTRNLLRNQKTDGKASVRTFVKKRFLRIVPPLVLVALITISAALFIYSPPHLIEVGQEVVRAATFNSNLFFYGQAGYFAPENELRPMLHSWSLSVEEQFYILFAALIFLARYIRFQSLLVWAFGISLVLYGVLCLQALNPDFEIKGLWPEAEKSEAALFYLTPFRMIQFLSGACMAVLHDKVRWAIGFKVGGLLLGAALSLLIAIDAIGLLVFSNLLASLAALMLLQKNKLAEVIGQFGPVKFIARTSYQIYLVHWPLIVFWRYITLSEFGPVTQIVLAALSILLGWGLLKTTRSMSSIPRWKTVSRPVKLGWASAMIATIGVAGMTIQSEGFPSRVPVERHIVSAADQRAQESAYCDGSHMGQDREYGSRLGDPIVTCDVNPDAKDTLYVFGDSHARHLIPGLAKHFPNHRIAVLYFSSCLAQSGIAEYVYDYEGRTAYKEACLARNRDAMTLFSTAPSSTIIIHQLAGYHSDTSDEFYDASGKLIEQLETSGHNVVWLGSVVKPDKLMEGCNYLPATFPEHFLRTRCEGDKETAQRILTYTEIMTDRFPDTYLNMSPFFCPNYNSATCVITRNGTALFRDKHHLTVFGSQEFIGHAIETYPYKFPVKS